MARAPDERYQKAYKLYKQGLKLVEIASQLNLPEGTVRRWKSTHKWDNERSDKKSERSHKTGAPKGNKNSTGHAPSSPPGNKNAERYGFFAKWLPEETQQIMGAIQSADPLDLLWDNIQLQYTAIIRAQKLMYVKDQQDKTVEKVMEGTGNVDSEKWEVQQAWDKHATFLQAQSRAMKTLESMIKQYDELLHKNWDMATEEQRTRVELLKAQRDKITSDTAVGDDERVVIVNDLEDIEKDSQDQ